MFSSDTIDFLSELRANNEREWFSANKASYKASVKDAADGFCQELAELLGETTETSVNAKLFRINRDLRFSKDKRPYNTHVHMSFYASERSGPAWMVGLEIDRLVLGFGMFAFTPDQLAVWREHVAGHSGVALSQILDRLKSDGGRLDEPELKRVPKPYDQDHPQAELLRRKGLAVWLKVLPVDTAFGGDGPTNVAREFKILSPLRDWFKGALPVADDHN